MDKLFVQLSKLGDIINLLPIAFAAHSRGEKVGIMACKEYADVLDGASYVEKVVFDGKPWDIAKAVEEAKKLCPNVVVTMVNGPKDKIEEFAYKPAGQTGAMTDSFCRESWKLAGCAKEWGKVPLVFDKRDPEREAGWLPKNWNPKRKNKKIILFSNGSASSPFPYRNLLKELVTLKYGKDFNIIDLGLIKAERFYDLLGLYNIAHCLITVDTSHLHLAAAVPTLPVMAFVQDHPIYWYGTAWRPQHHFFCRYRDFPWRVLEMFTAIENINSKPNEGMLQVYHGSVRPNDTVRYFPIQYGACKRDAVNVLNDDAHMPMLQDVIRMVMQVAKPSDLIFLTREDVKIEPLKENQQWSQGLTAYAWRMNRDKSGNDTFFPAADLFAAPVDFWVKIFSELPDIVFGIDSYWSRLLMEIFKKHGATEIEGIFRNDF